MKITNIEQQKKRKNRYNVFIDDEFAFGVDEDVIIKCSLKKDKEISDSFIENIVKAEENSKAFNYSILLLAYRPRSISEIKTKMNQKGYEQSSIDNAIKLLEKNGYLNDYAFGKSFIKDKQEFKKAGKNLLKQELYKKGIDRDVVDQLIEETVNEDEEYERALAVAQKKNNIFRASDDLNSKRRKLYGLLGRKGYSFDIISKVINEVLKENQEGCD